MAMKISFRHIREGELLWARALLKLIFLKDFIAEQLLNTEREEVQDLASWLEVRWHGEEIFFLENSVDDFKCCCFNFQGRESDAKMKDDNR